MKEFMRKKILLGFFLIAGISCTLYAATYLHRLTVGGVEKWRINNDGSTFQTGYSVQEGPARFGDTDTLANITLPTTTTGNDFSNQLPVYNPTASSIAAGSLLVASGTGSGYINIAPATADLTSIVGVSVSAISATSMGWMVPRGGGYAVVLTTGAIAVGDALVSSGTAAGYAGRDTTPTTGADFGTAMTAVTSGPGSVLAILH